MSLSKMPRGKLSEEVFSVQVKAHPVSMPENPYSSQAAERVRIWAIGWPSRTSATPPRPLSARHVSGGDQYRHSSSPFWYVARKSAAEAAPKNQQSCTNDQEDSRYGHCRVDCG